MTAGFEAVPSGEAEGFVNATEDAGPGTPTSMDEAPSFEEAGKPG